MLTSLLKKFNFSPRKCFPNPQRWLVLDCESTGLNPKKDYLLAISAIGVNVNKHGNLQINYADFFEVFVRPPKNINLLQISKKQLSDIRQNVMVHGIGIGSQQQGLSATEALIRLQEFIGNHPDGVGLIGFHSGFDESLLTATAKANGLTKLPYPWLDLDPLVAELNQKYRRYNLDHWLNHYHINCPQRHNATADTLATAELFLRMWCDLRKLQVNDWQSLIRKASDGRDKFNQYTSSF